MKWLFQVLVAPILTWWRGLWRRRRDAFTGVVYLEASVDPKSELAAGRLVLIGSKEKPKWLRVQCPCGCGAVIALNLMSSHNPRWYAEVNEDGTLTVSPSIDAKACGSHFWIRRNKVDWHMIS